MNLKTVLLAIALLGLNVLSHTAHASDAWAVIPSGSWEILEGAERSAVSTSVFKAALGASYSDCVLKSDGTGYTTFSRPGSKTVGFKLNPDGELHVARRTQPQPTIRAAGYQHALGTESASYSDYIELATDPSGRTLKSVSYIVAEATSTTRTGSIAYGQQESSTSFKLVTKIVCHAK